MTDLAKLLDWSHATTDIPAGGRAFTREATEAERSLVVRALDILGCTRLTANYRVRPTGGGRFRLEGTLVTDITQTCVVSLKPVASSLRLPIDVDFCNEMPSPDTSPEEEAEIFALPDVALIENGRLEVGAEIFDVLSAGLDPFPRAEGASFGWTDPKETGEKPKPFAVLERLKNKPGR